MQYVWEGYEGGISRLKYHLAQLARHEVDICKNSTLEIVHRAKLAGHEVDICKNSTPEIVHRAKLAIEGIGKRKDEREALR